MALLNSKNIRRKITWLPVMGIVILCAIPACLNEKNRNDCEQGIIFGFYAQTECQSAPVYPQQITNLSLFVFNENEILVDYRQRYDIRISPDYTETFDLGKGRYTAIAWAGIRDTYFDIQDTEIGITTKTDLLFRVKRQGNDAVSLDGVYVFDGCSEEVLVPERTAAGAYERTALNLREVTNRITVRIDGLPKDEDIDVEIQSDNGSMMVDGEIAEDEMLCFDPVTSVQENLSINRFTLLDLVPSHNYELTISDEEDNELYSADLLEDLLLRNPNLNLDCTNDFTIQLTVEEQDGTYVITTVRVNDWLVHSYDKEM